MVYPKIDFYGTEDVFPKKQILARIETIKDRKDNFSLDELADMFSPSLAAAQATKKEIVERNIVSKIALDFFVERTGAGEPLPFDQLLQLYLQDKLLQTGEMSLDEGGVMLQAVGEHYPKFQGKNCELLLIRKMGVSTFLIASSPVELYAARLNIASCIEELKLKLL